MPNKTVRLQHVLPHRFHQPFVLLPWPDRPTIIGMSFHFSGTNCLIDFCQQSIYEGIDLSISNLQQLKPTLDYIGGNILLRLASSAAVACFGPTTLY